MQGSMNCGGLTDNKYTERH